MSVYVDAAGILYRGKPRHHLTADSLAELHAFAESIGVKRCWFHKARTHPHYDVTDAQREKALQAGAEAVDTRVLAGVARRLALVVELELDAATRSRLHER